MEAALKVSKESGNYRSILKSTTLIGGASVLNILIGMVRTKFVAILLGPAGVGLFGMYGQITGLVGSVTGMGIGSSGVRQVAEAVGTEDNERIARTIITLRRTALITGGLGMLVMVVLCVPISSITFGNNEYALPIAILGVTLLFGAIGHGQGCILNGTRRIGDLAKISVIGAANGTLISIPCFYLWGQGGIVPSLIFSSMASLATSWWFARRVPIKAISLPLRDSYDEAQRLLSLGISFMGAGLAAALSGYLIRIIILRQFDLADLGIYQAAFNLSGILVGFVLHAMGTDYYPRLTAVAGDNASVHSMVNEQSQISILLSLPGLAAMMVFAPLIIQLFYAASFATAVPVLRWCIMGILGRVFSWPLGFVMLAKGKGKLFFVTEAFACVLHLIGVFAFIRFWGLKGAGIAFMVLYIVYTVLMLLVMRKLVRASWTRRTFDLALFSSTVMITLMLNCSLNENPIIVWILNFAILGVVTGVCLLQLLKSSNLNMEVLFSRFK